MLDDPVVHAHTMDGGAWLRRSNLNYDVITLEPMPPTFAGSNALYSREFYELMRDRLNEGGVADEAFGTLQPQWPGLSRPVDRGMSPSEVRALVIADPIELQRYAELDALITDDNQRLSYGYGRERWWGLGSSTAETLRHQYAMLRAMIRPGPAQAELEDFLASHPLPGTSGPPGRLAP